MRDSGVVDSGENCAGCTEGSSCVSGDSASACGRDGKTCVSCEAQETCISGSCTACAGCIDDGGCEPGASAQRCGIAGEACISCAATQTCLANACQSCAGCIDSSGVCQAGNATGACGASGAACANCAGDQTCFDGACCSPSCVGRVCGSDGCGGSCGTCPGTNLLPLVCNSSGQCLNVTGLSAGGNTTCVTIDGGPPQCWGRGPLGDNSGGADSPVPVQVALSSASSIAVGGDHICAVTPGAVQCWGAGNVDQLGSGSYGSAIPVVVPGVPMATWAMQIVAAGYSHTCSWAYGTPNSSLVPVCWGAGGYGQLGNGVSNKNSATPVDVQGLPGGTLVMAGGGDHTCSVNWNGSSQVIACWGDDENGQLGNGQVTVDSPVAGLVSGLSGTTGMADLSAGAFFTCAQVNYAVWCWGQNDSGQLGNGTSTDSDVPVAVNGLASESITTVAAGDYHACASDYYDGWTWCWGDNTHGQLGDGTTTQSSLPVPVVGLDGVPGILLVAGSSHSCELLEQGLVCWGSNSNGQLGNDSTTDSSVPVSVVLQ